MRKIIKIARNTLLYIMLFVALMTALFTWSITSILTH